MKERKNYIKKTPDISKEHLDFLKGIKTRNRLINATRVGILILALILWEVLALLNIIDSFIMSKPSRIFSTLFELSKTTLWYHTFITLLETIIGFLIATVVGIIFAVFMWWFKAFKDISEPYLVVLNCLPKIALGPIIIIWFGAGYSAIIAMTVLITIVITILTADNAFSSVDKNAILLLQSMKAKKFVIFKKLIFPASIPTLLSMLKINIGLSFVGSVMGEYLVSRAGLGYLIVYGGQVFNLDLVLACTIVLMILACALYFLLSLCDKFNSRYE